MDAAYNRRTANLLLAVIFIITALVWVRACRISYVSDDYLLELHSFAPITSARDVAERFTSPAVNLRYWRPVPDGLAVVDFLLWGWNGRGFHLTNLIVHLLATLLAFFVIRDVFGRPTNQALAVTLLFGVAASHEANILWPPGRADAIATLFVLLALILERRARGHGVRSVRCARGASSIEATPERSREGRAGARIFAVASFLLALASKEIAVVALAFLVVMPDQGGNVKRRIAGILPYVAAAAFFFLYRSRLVEPMSGAPIFAGAHSLGVFAMNAVYALGYTILPLDLAQALRLLGEYRTPFVVSAAAACALIAVFGLYVMRRREWRSYLVPIAYTAATGAFVVFSFERWRVYMMSVGVFTLLVMGAVDLVAPMGRRTGRAVLVLGATVLILFNIARALSAETTWLRAGELRRSLQADLGRVLAEHTQRPVTFLFLDRPAKLGSAPLLQLAIRDVLTQAALEQSGSPRLATGGMRDMTVDHVSATLLLALDEERGFRGLRWKRIDDVTYDMWVEGNPGLAIVPAMAKTAGRAGRDQAYAKGDTLQAPFADVILLETGRTSAKRVRIVVRDSTLVPLMFDGEGFSLQEEMSR
jgi:hypothetical protein